MKKYIWGFLIFCTFLFVGCLTYNYFTKNQESQINNGVRCLTCESIDGVQNPLPSDFTETGKAKNVRFNVNVVSFGRDLDSLELLGLRQNLNLWNDPYNCRFAEMIFAKSEKVPFVMEVPDAFDSDGFWSPFYNEIVNDFADPTMINIFVFESGESTIKGAANPNFRADSTQLSAKIQKTVFVTFDCLADGQNFLLSHEIGHLFGMRHNFNSNTCMDYNLPPLCLFNNGEKEGIQFYANVKFSDIALPPNPNGWCN